MNFLAVLSLKISMLMVLSANTESGNFIVRDQHTVEQYVENRKRTALNLSLQWAPESGEGMVYLDLKWHEAFRFTTR